MNKSLQKSIDTFVTEWWEEDSYLVHEYNMTFGKIDKRADIYKVVVAAIDLGIFLEPEQAFTIWMFLSGEWACSGFMDVPEDKSKVTSMLSHIFDVINYKESQRKKPQQ